MSEIESHTEIRMGSERSFGLVFCAVFLIVSLWPMVFGNPPRLWAGGTAAGFAILAFALPRTLRPLNVIWFRFGLLLNRIVSPLVLGILFFLVVTPTGLLMRLRNPDLLGQRIDKDAASYWIKSDEEVAQRTTMRKQF